MTSLKKTGCLIETQITHKGIFIMRNNKKDTGFCLQFLTESDSHGKLAFTLVLEVCNFPGMGMADT